MGEMKREFVMRRPLSAEEERGISLLISKITFCSEMFTKADVDCARHGGIRKNISVESATLRTVILAVRLSKSAQNLDSNVTLFQLRLGVSV